MKKVLVVLLVIFSLFLIGCSQSIEEVKNDEHIGQEVKVSGVVKNPFKLGQLAGYQVIDENGDDIGVSSQRLPAEGDNVIVKGTLQKNDIFGYYIEVDE